jgi:restriction system protein
LAGDVLRASLRASSVRITPPSRDDGIDGVLTFDDLGIRRVVFQAKRYGASNHVDRPEIDQFWAAVQRQRADYGVFVTTSAFTKGAQGAANDFGLKLVDGNALVELMAKHSIGVRTLAVFSLYEVDVTWSEELDGD